MDIEQFRNEIRTEFGQKLEHATPAHMRQFLNRMYSRLHSRLDGEAQLDGVPFTIPTESASNYEQVVAEYFSHVLDYPPDLAVITLWLFSCEMFYTHLEDAYKDQFQGLFSLELPE